MTLSSLYHRWYLLPSASETASVPSGDHPCPWPNGPWVVPTHHKIDKQMKMKKVGIHK